MCGGSIELVDWLIKELGFDVQQVTKVRWTVARNVFNTFRVLLFAGTNFSKF